MTKSLFVIAQPLLYNYEEFFELAVSKIPRSSKCVDVLITSIVDNSSQLNIILSSSYTQIRKRLLGAGFAYDFDINVYVNRITNVYRDYQVFYVEHESVPAFLKELYQTAIQVNLPHSPSEINNTTSPITHHSIDTVAVGGTFDHLHDGHKILLSMSAFAAQSRLIIGVTGPELLKNKKYASVIESLGSRIRNTCNFLRSILQHGQRYEVYQINDVCGPTGFISDIDLLVVSEETIKGASFVNSYRVDSGFSPLKIISVDVIGGNGNQENNWSGKLSSTDIRKLEFEKRNLQ